jgi:hypothetical protein
MRGEQRWGNAEELRDWLPTLKGLPLPGGLEPLGSGAWPGREIGKFNHSIA